ncbi:MAG: hypothetical protein RLZ98_3738 [Pseudomonadota bacterium]
MRKSINTAKSEAACARKGFGSAFAALATMSGLINLMALTGSIYMLQVYDRVLTSHSIPTLVTLTVIVGVVFLLQGLLEGVRSQAFSRIALVFEQRLTATINRVVLLRTNHMSRSEAQQPLRDMDSIRSFVATGGPVALFDLPWMPIYVVFLFILHPVLGYVCLGGIVVIACLALASEYLTAGFVKEAARADAARRAMGDEATRSAEVIRAMGLGIRASERLALANDRYLHEQTRATDRAAVLTGISRVVRLALQSGVLGIGAYLVIEGQVTAGAIIAASISASRALAPLEQAIAHWRNFLSARQGYRRLLSALDGVPTRGPALTLPRPCNSLSLRNVAVAVNGTRQIVLQDAEFDLAKGQALAILGPSAAGKSSLARVLCGVWPIARGSIRLDGAEFEQWSEDELGRHIGYMPQENVLFHGTVAENIARLEDPVDEAAVLAAAKAAGVHDLILGLPDGYETNVGADGVNLSAGQRQRIALARALYKDPFLVVLDEPNSNLDADGEAALTAAIQSVKARGGIAVVVAHRPSALAAADFVAMLSAGRIAAFGPTSEVLKKVLRQPIRAVNQAGA